MAKSRTVSAVDLAGALQEVLKEYGDAVYTVLEDCVKDASEDAVKQLQSVSRFAPGRRPSGEYSRSWKAEIVPTSRLKVKTVVHNEEHYRLTHLLENGHVSRNGTGRTFGRVPAYPHIAPVNDWVEKELPRMVKERLGR